jgi:hypothetical protein
VSRAARRSAPATREVDFEIEFEITPARGANTRPTATSNCLPTRHRRLGGARDPVAPHTRARDDATRRDRGMTRPITTSA